MVPSPNENLLLIDLLLRKTNGHFEGFCDALVKSKQDHLVSHFIIADDLERAVYKIAEYYVNSKFTDVDLYSRYGEDIRVKISELYSPMVWKEADREAEDINSANISIHHLLKQMIEKQQQRLVIAGEPGSGKSTFLKKLANEWGESKLEELKKKKINKSGKLSVYSKFKLLFLYILRFIRQGWSLLDVLRDQYDFLSVTEMYACIRLIENEPDKCLILMDGLDEYDRISNKEKIFRIISKQECLKILCVSTTRPESVKPLRDISKSAVEELVNLSGFNNLQIEQYTALFFKDQSLKKSFMNHITKIKPQFLELSRIPIRAEMMCLIWKKYQNLGDTLNDLYSMFSNYVLQHMEKKFKREMGSLTMESELNKKYHQLLLSVAEVAYAWNNDGTLQITFPEQSLKQSLSEKMFTEVTKSGFLSHKESKSSLQPSVWYFTHLTIQEHFVAYHLMSNEGNENVIDEFVYGCLTVNGLKSRMYILEFLFGLSTKTACNILKKCIVNTKEENYNLLLEELVTITGKYAHLDGFSIPLPSHVVISEPPSKELLLLIQTDQCVSNKNLHTLQIHMSNEIPLITHAYVQHLKLIVNKNSSQITNWKCNFPNLKELSLIVTDNHVDVKRLVKAINHGKLKKLYLESNEAVQTILCNIQTFSNIELIEVNEKNSTNVINVPEIMDKLKHLKCMLLNHTPAKFCLGNILKSNKVNVICSNGTLNTVQELGDFLIKSKQTGDEQVKSNGFIFNQCDLNLLASSVSSVLLNLSGLKIFGLQNCQFRCEAFKNLSDFVEMRGVNILSLNVLDFSYTILTSSGIYIGQCLRYLPNLQSLLLVECGLGRKDITDISRGYHKDQPKSPLPITNLDLSDNNLQKHELQTLMLCENLQRITLQRCHLRGPNIIKVMCSKKLEVVDLSGNDFQEICPSQMCDEKFKNLNEVVLKACFISEEQLSNLIIQMPSSITKLDISGQEGLNQLNTSEQLLKKLSKLKQLKISSCSEETEKLRWHLRRKNPDIDIRVSEDDEQKAIGFGDMLQLPVFAELSDSEKNSSSPDNDQGSKKAHVEPLRSPAASSNKKRPRSHLQWKKPDFDIRVSKDDERKAIPFEDMLQLPDFADLSNNEKNNSNPQTDRETKNADVVPARSRGVRSTYKFLVALPRPLLDLDLSDTNRQLGEVDRVCALRDGGALLYNKKNNQRQVVRVNREGETVSPPCICKEGSVVTCIITDNEERVYIIQYTGYITVCNIEDLSQTLDTYNIQEVSGVRSGVLIRDQLILPDWSRGEIFKYNLTRREKTIILTGLCYPISIAYRNEGDVDLFAVCEWRAHRVTLYDGTWKVRATAGSLGKADGQLLLPNCVIFSPTGSLLVADYGNNRISEFSQQGVYVRHVVTPNDKILGPVSISYSNGCLWVAGIGGDNVKRFTIH